MNKFGEEKREEWTEGECREIRIVGTFGGREFVGKTVFTGIRKWIGRLTKWNGRKFEASGKEENQENEKEGEQKR